MPVCGMVRRFELEGAKNFRDFGGYPTSNGSRVAWRRLFRSDLLSDLTDNDLVLVGNLGLRTVCDLRGEEERRKHPDKLPCNGNLRFLANGFLPHGGERMIEEINAGKLDSIAVSTRMREVYRDFPTVHLSEFRKLIEALLEPDAVPILIHCSQGKDRTGFAAAIILMALGVGREVILSDYLLSNQYRRELAYTLSPDTGSDILYILAGVQQSFLDAAFRTIEEVWGSDDAFLTEAMGLGRHERQYLLRLLTE